MFKAVEPREMKHLDSCIMAVWFAITLTALTKRCQLGPASTDATASSDGIHIEIRSDRFDSAVSLESRQWPFSSQ